MPSRVSTGFHRLGLMLSLPLLLGAAIVAYQQWAEPSGPYVVDLPEGVQAWKADARSNSERQFVQMLIQEQKSAGITAPPDFIVLGVPLGEVKQAGKDWTRYQLRDGREIGIASTDKNAIYNTAGNFLYSEKARGQKFTDKDNMEFNGVRVAFLNYFDQISYDYTQWPRHRERD